jgi:ubiquinone/menaquinone biosynthesis C-methylase UbiE
MANLSAAEIQNQLVSLKDAARSRSPGELGRVDQVSKEFLDLRIPRHAEVLDVAAGSGILSAELQIGGYYNIDALDSDLPTLQSLQALRLYRNYIFKTVDGLLSTGLREESYDVVITAGGFAQDAINPLDITEMLRILRPDGYLLWTMRTVREEGTTEFGLLEANLRSLEKSGRCRVMKHNTFVCPDTKALGVFYMVKRLVGSLPDYLPNFVPKGLKEQISSIMVDNSEPLNRVKFYDDWCDKYDEDLVIVGNYTGHIKCVEAFLKLDLNRKVNILDLAAGTGLLGAEVQLHGYESVDGLDASLGMLGQARKQQIYQDYIVAMVDGLGSIPINDSTYDVVMSSNGFAPGQIYPKAIPEILRVIRPGGYLIWTMREGYQQKSQRFALMDAEINDIISTGAAEMVVGPVVFENFVLEHPGKFYMMRKAPSVHPAMSEHYNV